MSGDDLSAKIAAQTKVVLGMTFPNAHKGETGMVPVTGKERPMLRPEAASTEARFESASLHQCPYCGTADGLRIKCAGYGDVAPEYTCEACFTGTDDGPSFDDLKPA